LELQVKNTEVEKPTELYIPKLKLNYRTLASIHYLLSTRPFSIQNGSKGIESIHFYF